MRKWVASLSLLSSLALSPSIFAMGQGAEVFETSTPAGIWDHGREFYLRLDLVELADLKNQTFMWAGFHQSTPSHYTGEVVADQFGKNERRFPARAKLMESTSAASYYRIEILGEKGEVIKEVLVKGPARPNGARSISE